MESLRARVSIPALAALALLVTSCRAVEGETTTSPAGQLGEWMTGVFSSAAQAETDRTYYPVRLAMVPIWSERSDGPWLYVEQAMVTDLDEPYRQRVYHLAASGEDGEVGSDVYSLPGNPLVFAGAWREPGRFGALSLEDLELRCGCTIHLRFGGTSWAGATRGKECRSSLRGAAYATSEVVVTPERLTSWDRGFNAEDRQVWGAVAGPYVFDRVGLR